MALENCFLLIDGTRYGGWKSLEVERGIEQLSGSFHLEVTDRWAGQLTSWPIRPGDACQVLIDDDTVVTGYVDNTVPRRSARGEQAESRFTVAGRDATADMIDCAAIYKSGQWINQPLSRIARDLAAPFAIEVVIDPLAANAAGTKIASHKIEEGESAFECLERAARSAAILLITDGRGRLVLTRAGTNHADVKLAAGENILEEEARFDWAGRFSDYLVKGQARDNHAAQGKATDDTVTRYRPLIVLAEDAPGGPTAQQRAEWEAATRAGRANRATVTVQGWRQQGGTGALWTPGIRVPVRSDLLRVDGDLLIVSVRHTLDQEGRRTRLELADPRAFDKIAGIRTTKLKSAAGGPRGLQAGQNSLARQRRKGAGGKDNYDAWL